MGVIVCFLAGSTRRLVNYQFADSAREGAARGVTSRDVPRRAGTARPSPGAVRSWRPCWPWSWPPWRSGPTKSVGRARGVLHQSGKPASHLSTEILEPRKAHRDCSEVQQEPQCEQCYAKLRSCQASCSSFDSGRALQLGACRANPSNSATPFAENKKLKSASTQTDNTDAALMPFQNNVFRYS